MTNDRQQLLDELAALRKKVADLESAEAERQKLHAVLRKSEEQLAFAIENSRIGLWDWMVQTGEATFNQRWAAIIGHTLQELSPVSINTWRNKCHKDDLQHSDELLEKHFAGETPYYECEARMHHKDGRWVWVLDRGRVVERDKLGEPVRMIGTHVDITERKTAELEREILLRELKNAFDNIKTLSGLLPICASCKKIRDDEGYWEQIEVYIKEHSDAEFTHGLCPDCAKKLYPDIYDKKGD